MCKNNTETWICGHPLSKYVGKSNPGIIFCPLVRGAIVVALAKLVKSSSDTNQKCTFANTLISNHLSTLARHCSIDVKSTNRDYRRVIVAFKNLVKWIERSLEKFHVLVRKPSGWAIAEDFSFPDDETAGLWFNGRVEVMKALSPGQQSSVLDLDNLSLASLSITDKPPQSNLRADRLASLGRNTGSQSVLSWNDGVSLAGRSGGRIEGRNDKERRMDSLARERYDKFQELADIEKEEREILRGR